MRSNACSGTAESSLRKLRARGGARERARGGLGGRRVSTQRRSDAWRSTQAGTASAPAPPGPTRVQCGRPPAGAPWPTPGTPPRPGGRAPTSPGAPGRRRAHRSCAQSELQLSYGCPTASSLLQQPSQGTGAWQEGPVRRQQFLGFIRGSSTPLARPIHRSLSVIAVT